MDKYPIRRMRKLHKLGGGFAVFIPKEWFNTHKLDPNKIEALPMDANRHIVILNPKDAPEEYDKFSQEVGKKIKEALKRKR